MKPLQFITMNTGHSVPSKRSDVADEVITIINRHLDDGSDLVDGWDVTAEIHDGYATFGVSADTVMLSLCAVCWRAACSPAIWQMMCSADEVKALAKPGVAQQPPHVPWLAATILSSAGYYSNRFGALKAQARLFALGDLERCVAWTIIERSNRKSH